MSLALQPGVLNAAFDLAAVRSITSAVRGNLIAAGGTPGPLGTVQMPTRVGGPVTRTRISPEPRIEGRHVHRPEPRIEGRWVHRPEPRVEVRDRIELTSTEPPSRHTLARVWEMPIPEPTPVQPEPAMTDNSQQPTAGALLDVFA